MILYVAFFMIKLYNRMRHMDEKYMLALQWLDENKEILLYG